MGVSSSWSYLRGYVLIAVEGDGVERFINLALGRGIRLWDISRFQAGAVLMKVNPGEFRSLRQIARKTRCRVRIRRKYGLPFTANRLAKRRVLVWGAFFFLCAIYVLSSFVWSVNVVPQEELRYTTNDQILQVAEERGLTPGVPRYRVDVEAVEKHLQNRIPELAWVGIEMRGTQVTIRVVEKRLIPRDLKPQAYAHLVAAKDGVVKEILVMAGEAKVMVGDTVTSGQVLISGMIPPALPPPGTAPSPTVNPGPTRYVRARGIVRARIWYQTEEEMPFTLVQEVRTGRKSVQISLKFRDKEIIVKRGGGGFQYAQVERNVKYLTLWRNLQQPVEVITSTYHEVERHTRDLGPEGAKEAAEEQGFARLREQIPPGVQVVGQSVHLMGQDDRGVRLRLLVETVEDIAQLQPFNPS